MKRGKPLERKTALKANVEKVREFQQRARERSAENARDKPRKPLAKVSKTPRGKAAEVITPEVRKLMAAWGAAARGRPCANPRCRSTRHVEGHHALSKQAIRRICRTLGVDPHRWLWDRRLLVPLCDEPSPNRCHTRHESGMVKLPHELVPPGAIEVCEELDDMLEAAGKPREAMVTLSREWS